MIMSKSLVIAVKSSTKRTTKRAHVHEQSDFTYGGYLVAAEPLTRGHSPERHTVVDCEIPRKEKFADFQLFSRPPPSCFPGFTRGWPDDRSNQAPRIKKIGLIKTFSLVYPKKGERAPGKWKKRRFHAKSTSFLFKVSCSQLRRLSSPQHHRHR